MARRKTLAPGRLRPGRARRQIEQIPKLFRGVRHKRSQQSRECANDFQQMMQDFADARPLVESLYNVNGAVWTI